jgi:hypothetical protein
MSYYLGLTACDGGLSGINFADGNIGLAGQGVYLNTWCVPVCGLSRFLVWLV